jgi:hypothetical protein
VQKSNLFIFILISAFMLLAQQVSASALIGPSCFVNAEVIEIDQKNHYLNIKILNIEKDSDYCPVRKNELYRAIDNYYAADNYPASFKEGDVIKAGIEAASSMGPSGAVSFLQWSDVTYVDGSNIKYKKGIVTHLQSDSEPISIDNSNDTQEGNNIIQNDNQDVSFNYYYLIIPILAIVGFLLYWLLHKRSAP